MGCRSRGACMIMNVYRRSTCSARHSPMTIFHCILFEHRRTVVNAITSCERIVAFGEQFITQGSGRRVEGWRTLNMAALSL